MRQLILALAVAAAQSSWAGEFRFHKKVDPDALQKKLEASGFKVIGINCAGDDCAISLPGDEKKSPAPIVTAYSYQDPRAARRAEVAALKTLLAKWNRGTVTAEEKDELIRRFIALQMPEN